MHATVKITAKSWEESREHEVDAAHAIAPATFTTSWDGDITGESVCRLLICYVGGDPAEPQSLVGPYTGYEQVTAALDGRSGTFVLATKGFHGGGVARTEVEVVEDSGTGELAGISGSGSYSADAMQYTLELDYQLS